MGFYQCRGIRRLKFEHLFVLLANQPFILQKTKNYKKGLKKVDKKIWNMNENAIRPASVIGFVEGEGFK